MGFGDQRPHDGALETLEVVVGQRAEPALGGDQGVVTAYAGLGTRHVMVVADAAFGPMSTRAAPQTAASALVARVRTSLFRTARERLQEALADADRAVSEAATGTHAHGQAGCGLVCVYFDLGGATFARVGGGKAYVVVDRDCEAIFDRPAAGYIGDGVSQPEIRAQLGALPRGARIVLLSDATASAVAGDLAAVIAGLPPQLAAVRVVEAARRRGKREALACLILELHTDLARPYHPSVARAGRYAEQPLMGVPGVPDPPVRPKPRPRPAIYQPPDGFERRGARGGLVWGVLLALCLGIGVAIMVRPWEPAKPEPEVTVGQLIDQTVDQMPVVDAGPQLPLADIPVAEGALPGRDASVASIDEFDEGPAAQSPPRNKVEEDIAAAFAKATPKAAAIHLLRHLRKRFKRIGYPAYDEVSAWVKRNKSRHVVETLAYIMKGKHPFRTRRWLSKLMPDLLAP